jgi:hypothetical protein
MSVNSGTAFNFDPPAPMNPDQYIMPSNSTSQSFGSFSPSMSTSQSFAGSSPPVLPAPIIDALTVDTLAKDFQLEPIQRANLQAFVKVN